MSEQLLRREEICLGCPRRSVATNPFSKEKASICMGHKNTGLGAVWIWGTQVPPNCDRLMEYTVLGQPLSEITVSEGG